MSTRFELSRTARAALLSLAAILGLGALPVAGALIAPGEAHAVIGRPFTPMSYAGVARRTSRRTARRVAYRTSAMTTLPAGCVPSGAYYGCGSTYYQPAYDGGTVVYVEAEEDDD